MIEDAAHNQAQYTPDSPIISSGDRLGDSYQNFLHDIAGQLAESPDNTDRSTLTPEQKSQLGLVEIGRATELGDTAYGLYELLRESGLTHNEAIESTSWMAREGFLLEPANHDGEKYSLFTSTKHLSVGEGLCKLQIGEKVWIVADVDSSAPSTPPTATHVLYTYAFNQERASLGHLDFFNLGDNDTEASTQGSPNIRPVENRRVGQPRTLVGGNANSHPESIAAQIENVFRPPTGETRRVVWFDQQEGRSVGYEVRDGKLVLTITTSQGSVETTFLNPLGHYTGATSFDALENYPKEVVDHIEIRREGVILYTAGGNQKYEIPVSSAQTIIQSNDSIQPAKTTGPSDWRPETERIASPRPRRGRGR